MCMIYFQHFITVKPSLQNCKNLLKLRQLFIIIDTINTHNCYRIQIDI